VTAETIYTNIHGKIMHQYFIHSINTVYITFSYNGYTILVVHFRHSNNLATTSTDTQEYQ